MEFLITDSVGLEGGMLEEAPEGRRFEEDCNVERRNNPLQPTPFWALSWEFSGWIRKKIQLFFVDFLD